VNPAGSLETKIQGKKKGKKMVLGVKKEIKASLTLV
jgi:hypothetical protein